MESVPYQFTCPKCDWHGDKNAVVDFIKLQFLDDETKFIEVGKYAVRCRSCDTHYKRYKRTKRNLWRLSNLAMEYRQGYPKMVTVSLPSVPDDPRTLQEQLVELKEKWNVFRKYHSSRWLGGIYCTESTLKVNFDRDKGPWFGIKHHAHIHAVVVTPFLSPAELIKFSDSAHDIFCDCDDKSCHNGLGRATVTGRPHGVTGEAFNQHLAHYLSKYITKSHVGVRAANFGKIIGRPWPPPMSGGKNGENSKCSKDPSF